MVRTDRAGLVDNRPQWPQTHLRRPPTQEATNHYCGTDIDPYQQSECSHVVIVMCRVKQQNRIDQGF